MLTRFIALALTLAAAAHAAAQTAPNIVYIFADDMGWGTGQFNNPDSPIDTPHLNQLAADGLNFTRHYSATVCSPSRAMLMTGFHTGNTSNDRNSNIGAGLRAEEVTVADTLGAAGYQTAVFGKWGWGGSTQSGVLRSNPVVNNAPTLPQNKGFDEFYGYLNHGRAHSYEVDSLWTTTEPLDDDGDGQDEVGEKYQPNQDNGLWLEKTGNNSANTLANYTHDLVGIKSEQYIRDNAAGGQPFYMQVNYTIPHFDLDAITGTDPLRDLEGDVIFDGGLAQYAANGSMTNKQKKHAAMISRMDASIGSLVNRLDDPNGDGDTSDSVLANTLILFSSDNGPTPEDGLGAGSLTSLELAGDLRGGKRDLFEGGIRSPLLVRWDAKIDGPRRGTTDATPTDLADFMATAADVTGAATPVGIDGVSILPAITAEGEVRSGKVVISENFEGSQTGNTNSDWTVIRGDQKLIKFRNGAFGLYDLQSDPTESSPLSLAVPANLALKEELEAIALAEGAGRADNYFVQYTQWIGLAGNGEFADPLNWSIGTAPDTNWSATVNNTTGAPQLLTARESVAVLGLEVRGDNGQNTVDISPGRVINARNEVRVGPGGHVEIGAAELRTSRWVSISGGGTIAGQGVVAGVVYNEGVMAPGRANDLPPPDTDPEPLGVLAPRDLDTGQVTLVDFDFTGVQDDAPLTQTSTLDPNIEIAEGFNFGPATGPRNAADAGDEFNVQGFSTGTTLASALAGGHYLTYSIEADDGAGVILDEVRFDLWRNGVNAADSYAIFTSVDGFTQSDVLAQFSYPGNLFGVGNTQSITASPLSSDPVTGPVEVRVYGWGSNNSAGNTHFNFVSADGRVVAVPTWALDFAGVQDSGPLTATSPGSSPQIELTAGLDLGAGLSFSDVNDSGDEFNLEGWSTGTTRGDAQLDQDYLSFAVRAIEGLAMAIDSVTFELWREGIDSPTDFAVMSSLGGFSIADPAAGLATILGVGAGARERVVGVIAATQATQDAVEFRLYGWNAGSAAGNVHLDGVSLRALFQTVIDVDLDPTGELVLDGELHHLEGGLIDLEIGGGDNSDPSALEYDRIVVTGEARLEGDVRLTLVDGFTPSRGQAFELLAASEVSGAFAAVLSDPIAGGLAFRLVYLPDRVLAVAAPALDGDYNADGVVDGADYTVWRDSEGQSVEAYTLGDGDGNGVVDASDYALWASNLGASSLASAQQYRVPEPGAATIVASVLGGVTANLRRSPASD